MFKDNRLGYFEIEVPMIQDYPEVVLKVMSQVIVVEATNSFAKHSVRYLGLCAAFEPVPDGAYFPHYEPNYDQETGEVSWEKAEAGQWL